MVHEAIPFMFEGHIVRVIKKENAPRFVIKNLGNALGLTNARDSAKAVLTEDEYEVDKIYITDKHGKIRPQKVLTTNESGMYTFILRSNKPNAVKFRKWVTSEVIPAIMYTGTYTVKHERAKELPTAETMPETIPPGIFTVSVNAVGKGISVTVSFVAGKDAEAVNVSEMRSKIAGIISFLQSN